LDEKRDGYFDHAAFAVEDIDGMCESLRKKRIEFETEEPTYYEACWKTDLNGFSCAGRTAGTSS